MHPIIPQPPERDDFFTPEVIAFAGVAMSLLSALWSLLGLWLVYQAGCLSGECDSGDEGLGFGILAVFAGQAALAVPTITLFARMLATGEAPRAAISATLVGIAAAVVIVGITLVAASTGS